MIKESIEGSLNDQVQHEFYSAHVYLAMSAWFDDRGLPGFAAWMRAQYQEELAHGLKIFDFILDLGGRPTVPAIEQPTAAWASPLAAFEAAYDNEKQVSSTINDLYELAIQEHDHATQVMLQWFVTEQVEEEKTVSLIVDQLGLAGDDSSALLMLDQQLGGRVAGAGA